MDVERGAYHTGQLRPYHIIDKASELPDAGKKDTDTHIWNIREDKCKEQIRVVRDLLYTGEHNFRTVVLDSITAAQTQMKRRVSQGDAEEFDYEKPLSFHHWGALLNYFLAFMDDMRAVASPEWVKPVNVVITAGTDQESAIAKPLLDGQIRKRVGGIPDLYAYLYRRDATKDVPSYPVLQFESATDVDAKCRLSALFEQWPRGRIKHPNLTDIIDVINGRPIETQEESE